MKRRLLILTILVALFLTACVGAPDRSAPDGSENAQTGGKSVEECIEFIKESVVAMSGGSEVMHEGNIVEVVLWNEDVTEDLPSAIAKIPSYLDAWNEMASAFTDLSSNVQDVFQRNGHDRIIARVSIVESDENRAAILAAQNGKLVYDVVNHIDTLGVNKARADAAVKEFEGLIDGAEIGATTGTYKTTEIHLVTAFNAEEKPENWEEIKQSIVDRMAGVPILAGITLYVVLEAADGTILTTATNGKISYDVYEKSEESALPAMAQNVGSGSGSRIVYVSKNSHTIHSVSDCSGMKNYRSMTQSEADANGYKYCPNCW